MTPFEMLIHFVKERESIRLKKEANAVLPWTTDPILAQFRFTNVNREDDAVTKWIAQNWREPHADDPDVWFAMAVARHVNKPFTLGLIGYPVPWNPYKFRDVIRRLMSEKTPAYNAAYMIRASKGADWLDKADYLSKAVLGQLWERREELRPKEGDQLEDFHGRLNASFGLGSFMSAQVVADCKHVAPLNGALDWRTFAASGPGSRRGLNRLLGRDPKASWREADWRSEFLLFMQRLYPLMDKGEIPGLDAQCYQNVLCEYSKYTKAYFKEGRPKQRYTPTLRGLF